MINVLSVILQKKSYTTFSLNAPMCNLFGKKITTWWFDLSKENINITLYDIILGLPNRLDIINYLIRLGKLCIWECRKACIYPDFALFLNKVKIKLETEKYIAKQNGNFTTFRRRWDEILCRLPVSTYLFIANVWQLCRVLYVSVVFTVCGSFSLSYGTIIVRYYVICSRCKFSQHSTFYFTFGKLILSVANSAPERFLE